MDYLFEGVKQFSTTDFHAHRELFESLGTEQAPHTLFIGCSDSRVIPNLITNTGPGELFVIRNIANIVPWWRESGEFLATTSAIEYAVKVLEVENIIVCGHSNCGGCGAFYLPPERLAEIPHTRKWIELSKPVIERVTADPDLMADRRKREWVTEQLNIVLQMDHLMTFPYIQERVELGGLRVLGWHYIIQTGEIYNYEASRREFVKIE